MYLITILLAVFLASANAAEMKKDGNCSPEFQKFIGMLKEGLSELEDARKEAGPKIRFGKAMAQGYLGDHIDWEKMKAFSFRSTKVPLVKGGTIQAGVTHGLQKLQHWFNKILRENKDNKKRFKPDTSILDMVDDVQAAYDHITLKASREFVPHFDQINYFLNKMIRDTANFESMSPVELAEKIPCDLWRPENTSMTNSEIKKMLPLIVRSAQKEINRPVEMTKLRAELERLYDEMSTSKITMINALVKDMDKPTFMALMTRLTNAIDALIESPEVGPGLLRVLEVVVAKLRTIDFDQFFGQSYLTLLRFRTTHMHTDTETMMVELHRWWLSMQKGWWTLKTGRWPAMEKYIKRWIRMLKTDDFWSRADTHYSRIITKVEAFYKAREGNFGEFVSKEVHPLLVEAVEHLERFTSDIRASFKRMEDRIGKLDDELVSPGVWQWLQYEFKWQYQACWWRRAIPENLAEQMMSWMSGSSEVKDAMLDLFFRGWVERKRKPPGINNFFRRLAQLVQVCRVAMFGECSVPGV